MKLNQPLTWEQHLAEGRIALATIDCMQIKASDKELFKALMVMTEQIEANRKEIQKLREEYDKHSHNYNGDGSETGFPN